VQGIIKKRHGKTDRRAEKRDIKTNIDREMDRHGKDRRFKTLKKNTHTK